jgi:polysaccharide export outer membrane protein
MTVLQLAVYARSMAAKRASNVPVLAVLCSLVTLCLCSAIPAKAQHRLDPGDVIEISVARVPELQRRVPIRLDGSITFPLLGVLSVAGLPPSQVEAMVKAMLSSKVFQQRMPDGRENGVLIDHDEITVTVVEYRPVYVNGDVSRPGAHAYRPLMTVRQAVTLSGGYGVAWGGASNPYFELADLRSEYDSLGVDLTKERARIWRIKTELGEKEELTLDALMDIPLPRSIVSQILDVEAEHLAARQRDHQQQKGFLQGATKRGGEQIGVLSEAQEKEAQGVKADLEELHKVLDLYGKGSLPSPRVTDARRAVLLSATRQLQTTTQLMQVKRQQDDLLRQIERVEDQRQIELLRELQDAVVRRTALRAKLQSIGEKIRLSVLRPQVMQGNTPKPEIAITRKGEVGRERFIGNEDSELQPGDVVEVTLRLDFVASAPTQ